MTTLKLYITDMEDANFIKEKQNNYSYAFRLLFKMIEESSDKSFIDRFMTRFNLNDIEYRSLLCEVKSRKERVNTARNKKQKRIDRLAEVIADPTATAKERFKAYNTKAYLTRRLDKEPTFGGLALQRKLTREYNRKKRDNEKISQLTKQFREKRILPFTIVGEANVKGNRFFDLSTLANESNVTYKPFRGKKVKIGVKVDKNRRSKVERLVAMAEAGEIPVTIRLSLKYLYLSYDEEALNGFGIDERERRKDVKSIKSDRHPKEVEAALIKEKYSEYRAKQKERKMMGKISDRCIAIDMNPTNIGYSVLDRDGIDVKVITCGVFDLSRICVKSGKKSSDARSKYLVNKRKYEISMIVKALFSIAANYKCSSFVVEDLELEGKSKGREANRLVNNVWNRGKFAGIIARRCNESGIELVKVNPCYTSFIGNIRHPYGDSANASVEIGRRGLCRYIKGGFYPSLTVQDISTLETKFGDVACCGTDSEWVATYKSLRKTFREDDFSHRLRTGITEAHAPMESFSMMTCKSRIKLFIYNTLQ